MAVASATHRLKVLDANISGSMFIGGVPNPAPLQPVINRLDNGDIDIATLQEVCASQYASLVSTPALTDWAWFFAEVEGTNMNCPNGGEASGNVVGSAFSLSARVAKELPCPDADYRQCRDIDGPPGDDRDVVMACANVIVPGHVASRLAACSVHLTGGWVSDEGATLRLAQTKKIKSWMQYTYTSSGTAAILGGDFNAGPATTELDYIYQPNVGSGGVGRFNEADQIGPNGGLRRAGSSPTHHKTPTVWNENPPAQLINKFDYIFFSQNSTNASDPTGLKMTILRNGYSPHEILIATADVEIGG